MSNTLNSNAGDGSALHGGAAGIPAASLLSLAAAPTFVLTALWLGVAGAPADMMCSSGSSALSLNGMVAMYALMSIFHLSPWLTLLANWRNREQALVEQPKVATCDDQMLRAFTSEPAARCRTA